jgi:hypothetical protein
MLLKGTQTIRQLSGTSPRPLEAPSSDLLAWATVQVRSGDLAPAVRAFLHRQDESCDPRHVVVESVGPERMLCRVPAVADDSECPSPFDTEIRFAVWPAASRVERL